MDEDRASDLDVAPQRIINAIEDAIKLAARQSEHQKLDRAKHLVLDLCLSRAPDN